VISLAGFQVTILGRDERRGLDDHQGVDWEIGENNKNYVSFVSGALRRSWLSE
jgi:hypothetical protein